MPTAGRILASPLPPLRHAGGTAHASISSEYLHERFIKPWDTFEGEIRAALEPLGLRFEVAHIDSPSGEVYLVGNEIGLAGRFVNNVCDPVARILGRAEQRAIVMGDIQAFKPSASDVIPDVSIGVTVQNNDSRTQLKIVGELKTYWTVSLEEFSLSGPSNNSEFSPHLGQLVAQMRKFRLRYGFLSTYNATVFVHRVAPFAFHVSQPIRDYDTDLSVRQCFAGFCMLAEHGHNFLEGSDFDALRLRGNEGRQASSRASPYRSHATAVSPGTGQNINVGSDPIAGSLVTGQNMDITPNSIIVSQQGGLLSILNVSRRLSRLSQTDKALFLVDHQGTRYIVKCWSPVHDRASTAECTVYERLLESRPRGYDVFAKPILSGDILCSSLFPGGRALVLPYKNGRVLAHIWDDLSERERTHVREECEKAIRILRGLEIYVPDTGKHNVLYARETGTVTMLDFESGMPCPPEEHMPYNELKSLFGDTTMRAHASGG